jgi:hypothetical protein
MAEYKVQIYRGTILGLLVTAILLVGLKTSAGNNTSPKNVQFPCLREQADIQQEWLKLRLERNLPAIMRKYHIPMWLMICRHQMEDRVFFSLVSPTIFAARRTTMYIFYDRGEKKGIERIALGDQSNGGLYTIYEDPEHPNRELIGDAQWEVLKKLILERNPEKIAIDVSEADALADGLTTGLHEKLIQMLGTELSTKLVPAYPVTLEYQEMRLPEMLPLYRNLLHINHSIVSRALSNEVITPGRTTDSDVAWWIRDEIKKDGLIGDQPHVAILRQGDASLRFKGSAKGTVIEPGDVIHIDFTVTGMRMNTDVQQVAYVLKPGEIDVPDGIKQAMKNTNRLQDIVISQIRRGRTGNEILVDVLAEMRKENIDGTVYCHSIGDHIHGAGPVIGYYDQQFPVPDRGELRIIPESWFAIELNAKTAVPEWNNEKLMIGLEDDAVVYGNGRVGWVLDHQTKFHLIR